jgi:hypothetical protein
MKRTLLAAGIMSCVLAGLGGTAAMAASAENGEHYTQAQIKRMAHEAHTPEQYTVLAGYYDQQQKHFAEQAAEEKAEWARRSQYTQSIEAKYPRPVDSARYLYEYYAAKAAEAATLSAKYNQLAAPKAP